MKSSFPKKAAFLAASSFLVLGAANAHATALEADLAGYPTIVEMTTPVAVDHHDEQTALGAKKAGLWAAAIASLAGIAGLLGPRKLFSAVSKGAGRAASVAVKAGAGAAKAVGRAAASPLRFAALIAGLSLFAMTGVGLYDIEWIGGMIIGASLMGVGAFGVMKTRKALSPVRVKSNPARPIQQTQKHPA